ncbi:biotin transporter BioY [Sinanaerobacter chloroacetimidivorans]|uniref:Biotin transporter n=1 Tax=Sinanaerobacter chloroacetimidivorans TaxID=2818044 RepID=A0A8J8B2U0_9FIRM|nr:biotin transporter BioY [Sinanaerobacter chloroacetimidivorans]MBR0599081.1 biotin transporter BioY [Sinanaerobacter chloroacetimidivorans]
MKTKQIILYGLFAALTAVCSMISIPLPFTPVPINLATLSVFLAGGLLGSKGGAISQIVYVFVGAVGLPVFSNFTGGMGIVTGPTGGYIIGYIAAAWLTGFLIEKMGRNYYKSIIAMAAGLAACYLLGTLWFMYLTGMAVVEALFLCVIPFLIGDALKIIAGSILVQKLYKFV